MKKELQKAWDKTVTQIFLSKKNSGFLSHILTSLSVHWFKDEDSLAYVSGTELHIHEDLFLKLSEKARLFVVLHEIWHIARLHQVRQEQRDPKIWNLACDYVINYDLVKQLGYSAGELTDQILLKDIYKDLSEEEVYKKLSSVVSTGASLKFDSIGQDLKNGSLDEKKVKGKLINTVLKDMQQSKSFGSEPKGIEDILNKFVKPKVNWRALLETYLQETSEDNELTWKKPNKRFQDVYLPGKVKDNNNLAHLMFCLDTSGSISQEVIRSFVSEVKYIHETFQPELLTVVQFDYIIQSKEVFTTDDTFNNIKIKGYGGTSLAEVRELIIKEKPTAVVIFSDLYVEPMQKLPFKVPIIWVCVNNPNMTNKDVPCGMLIHLNIGE